MIDSVRKPVRDEINMEHKQDSLQVGLSGRSFQIQNMPQSWGSLESGNRASQVQAVFSHPSMDVGEGMSRVELTKAEQGRTALRLELVQECRYFLGYKEPFEDY